MPIATNHDMSSTNEQQQQFQLWLEWTRDGLYAGHCVSEFMPSWPRNHNFQLFGVNSVPNDWQRIDMFRKYGLSQFMPHWPRNHNFQLFGINGIPDNWQRLDVLRKYNLS